MRERESPRGKDRERETERVRLRGTKREGLKGRVPSLSSQLLPFSHPFLLLFFVRGEAIAMHRMPQCRDAPESALGPGLEDAGPRCRRNTFKE